MRLLKGIEAAGKLSRQTETVQGCIRNFSIFGTIVIAALGLMSYIPGLRILGNIRPEYIPMAISTAVFFITLGLILVAGVSGKTRQWHGYIYIATAFIISIFGLLKFTEYLIGIDKSFEEVLVGVTYRLGNIPIGIMSPATGLIFFLAGLSIVFYELGNINKNHEAIFGNLAGILSSAVFIGGMIFTLGYLYNTPFLYGRGGIVPMACTTAAAFLLLGIGQLMITDKYFPLVIFNGTNTRARLMRTFVPLAAVIVLSLEIIERLLPQSFENREDPLIAAAAVIFFTVIAILVTMRLGSQASKSIDQTETARKKAEEALRQSERRFIALAAATFEGIAVSEQCQFVDCNEQLLRMLGYSREEFIGMKVADLVPPEAHERILPAIHKGIENHVEQALLRKDGTRLIMEVHGQTVINEGRPMRFTAFRDITERKRAEQTLALQAAMLDATPGFVGFADAKDAHILYINPAGRKMVGIGVQEDVTRFKIADVHPEWTNKLFRDKVFPAVIRDGIWTGECAFLNRDGREIPVMMVLLAHKSPSGEVKRFSTISIDITERKKAEQSLQESEERFRTIFESSTDGILIADIDNKKFLTGNKVMCRMLGYSAEEIKKLGVTEIHPQEDLPFVVELFERQVRGEIILAEATPMKRKDGSVFYADINSTLITLSGKKYLLGSFRDITERKKAEEELRQSEERYRSVVDNIGIGVSLISPNMEILTLNSQMKKWFPGTDISKRPVCYKTFNRPPREDICSYCPTRKTLQDGQVHESITETPTGDKVCNYRVISSPVKDKGGKVIAAIEMVEDITESLKTARDLEQLNKDMKATIGKLSAANRELQEFAHITAHDLKSPIRSIGTLAEWLVTDYADKFDDNGKELARLLINRTKLMNEQISDILRYSEIGRLTLEKSQVNLNELVEEIIRGIDSAKNIKISIDAVLPTILCEKSRIHQVFWQLINNSARYMDKPVGLINIDCDQEDDYWQFSVTDNGPGIEEKYFEKIFQIFQTLAVDDQDKGAGMGLAIVKKIVELYDGKVWVKSKMGQGSTFFFTLPKQKQPQEALNNG